MHNQALQRMDLFVSAVFPATRLDLYRLYPINPKAEKSIRPSELPTAILAI